MAWSPQQDAALKAVSHWLRDEGSPVFRLFGYAGTGKTTLAKEIAAGARGTVLFGAYTGKASLVLRQKGCQGARTLHSLIYRLRDERGGDLQFELNPDSDVRRASLVIVDEVSMVDGQLGQDLLSFGTKILVLGDPAQLPPVNGTGFFDTDEPDVMLTEIHRQAAENPIIHLSNVVRQGGRLAPGRYGESEVVAPGFGIEVDRVLKADQILVGTNRTRRRNNDRYRELRGITGTMPIAGDKLVCLRNDRKKKLLNGGLWTVDSVKPARTAKTIAMKISSEDVDGAADIRVRAEFFDGTEDTLDWRERKATDEFTFGYALTVHKAQGSQWNDVVVFDESQCFRENRSRHLYTALTRAAETVTVVQ